MESWLSLLLLPLVGGNLLPENWIIDHGNHKHKNVHLDQDWSQKACQEGSHCIPVTYSSLSCSAWSNIQSTVEVKPIFDALQCGYLHEEPMVCIPSEYISRVPLCDIFQIKTETTNYNITTNEAILILGSSLNKTGQLWNTLSPPVCGTPILDLNRISGGQDSAPGEWPWMASLMYKSVNRPSDDLKFLCGGSLVSSRVVLTAAHCVNRTDQHTLEEVRLGENDFTQLFDCKDPSQECFGGDRCGCYWATEEARPPHRSGARCLRFGDCVPPYQAYKVDKVVKHPGFRKEGKLLNQDLALVFLDKVVQVTDQVQPACLPSKDFQMEKVTLKRVTGWGNTNGEVGNVRQADILQQLEVDLVTMEDCGNIWGFKDMEVTDDLICARSANHGEAWDRESVCSGDSGGPLVYSVNGRHYVQHGVVSVGAPSCGDPKPTIYAALNQDVVDWITNTVGKDNLPKNP